MTDETVLCKLCGGEDSVHVLLDDIAEGFFEGFYDKRTGEYICPDCYDNFNRMDAESKVDFLLGV
jgi:hypothetical protein